MGYTYLALDLDFNLNPFLTVDAVALLALTFIAALVFIYGLIAMARKRKSAASKAAQSTTSGSSAASKGGALAQGKPAVAVAVQQEVDTRPESS